MTKIKFRMEGGRVGMENSMTGFVAQFIHRPFATSTTIAYSLYRQSEMYYFAMRAGEQLATGKMMLVR